jgi:hypothetical protein
MTPDAGFGFAVNVCGYGLLIDFDDLNDAFNLFDILPLFIAFLDFLQLRRTDDLERHARQALTAQKGVRDARGVFLLARGRRGAAGLGIATLAERFQPAIQCKDDIRQYDAMGWRWGGVAFDHAVDQFIAPSVTKDGLVGADERVGCQSGRHAGTMGHAHTSPPGAHGG